IDRAGQTIAPRAIYSVLAEQGQDQEADQARQLSEAEREQEECGIERNEDCDGNQEPDQELARGSGIFEALARELGVGPQEAADVGGQPEPVDAERAHEQYRAAGKQPPKSSGFAAEANDAAHGRNTGELRRRCGGIRRWSCLGVLEGSAGMVRQLTALGRIDYEAARPIPPPRPSDNGLFLGQAEATSIG